MDWPAVWEQGGALQKALIPFSYLYALGWRMYLGWYRLGFKKRQKPDIPIIGVGSIMVGGAGKTPVTIALARLLLDVGLRPGISCNGYGGDGTVRLLEPDQEADPAVVGDEPAEIRAALPSVPMVVGRRRLDAARMIADRCDVLILDDGFQHLPLARDVDLLLEDAANPFGNGRCLPAGPLREPKDCVARANRVLRFGVDVERRPAYLERLDGGNVKDLGYLAGQDVIALSALGNPVRFEACLTDAGANVRPMRFPDHYSYQPTDVASLQGVVVTTAKDAVKLRGLNVRGEVWILREELTFNDPEGFRDWLLERLADRDAADQVAQSLPA